MAFTSQIAFPFSPSLFLNPPKRCSLNGFHIMVDEGMVVPLFGCPNCLPFFSLFMPLSTQTLFVDLSLSFQGHHIIIL